MEIIKNFGINPYLLGAQIINFLILFYVLKRFAFKPIMEILEKRRKEIQEGLKSAQEGKHALENALAEEKKILQKAQTEAQKIILDAKNSAELVTKEIKDQTKIQVETMLKEAKDRNARAESEMEKRVALSAAKLAVKMVQESISNVFTESEQKEVIERLTEKLQTKK